MGQQNEHRARADGSLSDEAVKKAIAECEARLNEIRESAKDESIRRELDSAEEALKACRQEMDAHESSADEDAWLEAKHGIVTKLNDVQKNLQLRKRRVVDYLR